MLHITELKVLAPYNLWLRFNDGAAGVANLADALKGEVFIPLRDPAVFATASLDAQFHTVTWPNGADFAPEYLRSLIDGAAVPAVTG